ncbi:MAG TPA: hypothetical protein VJ865_06465 [Gemmatimonadaceae bacterium]|nr:hypothetical protein [Gemmatimonadaceae bacterium]
MTARSVRIVHAAMAAGMILFGIIAHFVLAPNANPSGALATRVPVALAAALGLCAVSFLLLKRVPRATAGESTDSFWMRAASPAQITWALLEGAALLCIVLYSQTGSKTAIAVALIPIVILILLKPAYFERR